MAEAPDPGIRERTFLYAVRAVRLYESICKANKTASGVVLGEQFLRCATSLGANVDDAQHAGSRADYTAKLAEALKDAHEGLFWLRLMKETDTISSRRSVPLELDTREIISLLVAATALSRGRTAGRRGR